MPQVPRSHPQGWIDSEQLAMPRQALTEDQAEPFLEFVFTGLACRPEPWRLRETAGVVRYLRNLAAQGVPREIAQGGEEALQSYWQGETRESRQARARLDDLATRIWTMLLQGGEFKWSSKTAAERFLRRHTKTYLAPRAVEASLELMERLELPPAARDVFGPAQLRSTTWVVQGAGNPYLQNDLSERIYGAYHALRREKFRRVNVRIAESLTRIGMQTQAQKKAGRPGWTYAEVHERVKQYERSLRSRWPQEPKERLPQALQRHRAYLANLLIFSYQHPGKCASGSRVGRADAQGQAGTAQRARPGHVYILVAS